MRVIASASLATAFNATYACGATVPTQNYGEMEDYAITIDNQMAVPGFETSGFAMYPNPTNGLLKLKFAESTTVNVVNIYNISGRLVHAQQWNNSATDFELDLQGIASGVYIVKIDTTEGTLNKRLIKE